MCIPAISRRVKRLKSKNSIKSKLTLAFTFIVFIMGILSISTYYIANSSMSGLNKMVDTMIEANEVISEVKNIIAPTDENDSSSYLDRLNYSYFSSSKYGIQESQKTISSSMANINSLLSTLNNSYIKDDKGKQALCRIQNFFDSFSKIIKKENDAIEKNDIRQTIIAKDEAIKVGGFLVNSVQELISIELAYNRSQKEFLNKQIANTGNVVYIVAIAVAILSLIFSFGITNQITAHIKKLVEFSRNIASGNFEINDLNHMRNDELNILVDAFNLMKNNIKRLIIQIKENANIATRLKEKELENLTMLNELKVAELKSLQAQINPHFLFNTLNSISRVAYFSSAHEVVELIEAVADMLRYNLSKIDQPVSLEQEINSLRNYIFIQKVRFGDKIEFEININSANINILIPCLTLQPIVENAIIHGLDPYGYKGKISINIFNEENSNLIIEIEDNGIGMEPDILDAIINGTGVENTRGNSTGIGIKNVISRLNCFFKNKNIVSFKSEIGKGTLVRLELPVL